MSTQYIRWDKRRPTARHRSQNHVTGAAEAGLSVVDVKGERFVDLAQAVSEYGRVYSYYGARCWVVTGNEAGRGSDNEPLLRNVKVVREICGEELDRLIRCGDCLREVEAAKQYWYRNNRTATRNPTACELKEAMEGEKKRWKTA